MGKLTTHVLDTVSGKPGDGVVVKLLQDGAEVARGVTNGDGRLDAPLVEDGAGVYDLVFEVGEYFSRKGYEEGIFNEAVIRFEMKSGGKYHVPLVCTPWAYSTYRGS
ncbi:MAG: hydroxyisourate hydrolase [Luteolibacter sp.]